jgi:hypothetical protein
VEHAAEAISSFDGPSCGWWLMFEGDRWTEGQRAVRALVVVVLNEA